MTVYTPTHRSKFSPNFYAKCFCYSLGAGVIGAAYLIRAVASEL
ncbi:MAG: hypothetical protein AAF153_00365 [Pseudomonadota bacterium]